MHAGLSPQQAKSVFALDLDGGTFDSSGVTGGFVFNGGLEALALSIAQVLAQQHAGPVAGFGAASASLNVKKGVHWVGRVVEHAAELQPLDGQGQLGGFFFDGEQAGLVAVLLGHVVELAVVGQLAGQVIEGEHNAVERFFLAAELLGSLGVVPDARVFQRGVDGPQTFGFSIVVKGTP